MNDLRWQITQAVLDGEALQLSLSDCAGACPSRTVTLELAAPGHARCRRQR